MSKKKFVIIPGIPKGRSFKYSNSKKIEITFNPTEYSIGKSNDFEEVKSVGLISPILKFTKGKVRTLNVELMLDTFISQRTEKRKEDVRAKYIKPLQKLMMLEKEIHAPPPCRVLWGSLNFIGMMVSMNTTYTLFNSEGIPVRAKVKLSFKEFIPLSKQVRNPPLNSPDRRKVFKMTEGDSLWNMSNKAYGDPGLWRVIAHANNIDDPANIELGKDMIIPVL